MMNGEITGLDSVEESIGRLTAVARECTRRALVRCGLIALREAKANAPRSPTNKILSATLKRRKKTLRKMMPGGLEKSIAYEVNGEECSVFVAANSMAARYAKRIHDEKGQTWRNRGPGTVAKGPRADEKFIERAIADNEGKFTKIFDDEIRKALRK